MQRMLLICSHVLTASTLKEFHYDLLVRILAWKTVVIRP